MTRLFLRFYIGVLVILFVAWVINAYVYRGVTPQANVSVIEDALSGGARAVRDRLMDAGPDGMDAALNKTRSQFEYPVQFVPRVQRPTTDTMGQRLDSGDAVLYGDRLLVSMPESDRLLEFGPLPAFAGPTQAEVTIGAGTIFVLTAIAIAILLRPVALQLRAVERTALAISGGDLSARINGARLTRNLPLAIAFNSMADRIETLLRSQRELLQVVSHELRTPLARIKFATELLQSESDPDQQSQRIAAIDDATDQLDGLVGELLTYVKMDAGSESREYEWVQTDELVAELIDIHSPLHRKIDFLVSLSEPAPRVRTYRTGLYRAVGNLISNAAKHARSKVQIEVRQLNDHVIIAVDDDGPGIPQADRQLVFEPFKRRPDDTTPGYGLGLALVRRICRRGGGEVEITDNPWGGARLSIRLPVE